MHTAITPELPLPHLRVLHLVVSFARGGRRDAILSLARAGSRQGITPFLATLRGDPQDVAPYSHHFEATCHLSVDRRPSLQQTLELRRWCRNQRIDLVHAHDGSSQYAASMLRIVAPTLHTLMTFHRSLGFESAGLRNKVRNALTLPMMDRVITASVERRSHFLAENWIAAGRVEAIPLGVDLERFRPDPSARQTLRGELGLGPEQLILVSAGHFGDEKGVDRVIEAAASAVDLAPELPLHLAVMGTGSPERQEYIHGMGRRLLGDRVSFLGQRSDPERILQSADLLLHLPRVEAFGLAVVQAMACGLPVIATAVGGLLEVVAPERTGVLVQPEAHLDAAAAIVRMLRDPDLRSRTSSAAIERARDAFGEDLSAARHRELYQRLMVD